ncbi:MAG: aldolase catalytic domain-containing protein [Spirochaetales bacterium]|nr:aldolase catalytic domain-containing protein [Spirochaetales bacterium]
MAKENSDGTGRILDKDAKGWIGYRPEIKILDCTIRDGGLMNDHNFDDRFVKSVYKACVDAGIDYMELGYKASKKIFSPTKMGKWKFCDEEEIRKIVGENDNPLKLTAMADAERTDYHIDILNKTDSVLDMIRVATYIHQIPTAIDIIKDATDKGYETTVNLMAISTVQEKELDAALQLLATTPVGTIYLVDSFGSLYHEEIQALTRKYRDFAEPYGINIGIHAHNNQQLAYANTVVALIEGANMLDGTIDGLGRGAGNCPLELLLGFLHNPKFHLRPIIKCLQETIRPIKEKLKWGYELPYMITGQLNLHPRSAMKFLDQEDSSDYLSFYDSILQEE